MSANIDKLLERQERLSGRITRFMNNTDRTATDKQTVDYLEARMQLLQTYWSQFMQNNDLLYNGDDEEILENKYFVNDTYSDIERDYLEALGDLRRRLRALIPDSVVANSNDSINKSDSLTEATAKLPKISIQSFSGDYLEWPPFRDLYKSLIHTNNTIQDVQKFHYLKSCLSGEAQNLIKHISVTTANYRSAWTILENRYENIRALTQSYISSIMGSRAMTSESSTEIKRILDGTTQAVGALENLGRPTKHWDDWLTYVITQKLDINTRKDWENSLSNTKEVPKFENLKTFLEGRLRTLEAITGSSVDSKPKPLTNRSSTFSRTHLSTTSNQCIACRGKHLLIFCSFFKAKSVEQRRKFIREKELCFNCLKLGHTVYDCPSQGRCKQCGQQHHTMLHQSATTQNDSPRASSYSDKTTTSSRNCITTSHTSTQVPSVGAILLATAKVIIRSKQGVTRQVRALLDQGSESTFISNSIAKTMGLARKRVSIPILGIGNSDAGLAHAKVSFNICSLKHQSRSFHVSALVLSNLTSILPTSFINAEHWPHLQDIELADPQFYTPSPIDIIIGADLYAELLLDGIRRGPLGTPTAQRTHLGWILSGPTTCKESQTSVSSPSFHVKLGEDLESTLRRFWEIEEIPSKSVLTPQEKECEDMFQKTVQRDHTGRYIVRLPTKSNSLKLGNTREAAISMFLQLEKRLAKNSELQEQYTNFLKEYQLLGHMEPISDGDLQVETHQKYYLPHHAVLKPSSSSTKLRVVFNASHKSSTGISLNDCLHIGPKLQQDLSTIILRWRFYPIAYTADIEKMYRQIFIQKNDTDLQRIVWREDSSSPIKEYRLLTVTYGTASAPFLACRTLQQLAHDHQDENPIGSQLILNHFYVDDVLFGAYDLQSANIAKNELQKLLSCGGFKLHKWASNVDVLLNNVPDQDKELSSSHRIFSDADLKTLGIHWHPATDCFRFECHLPNTPFKYTKRNVLADISRLLDPLGWLAPVVIVGKIFMQKLWLAKLDWDDELPSNLATDWHEYRKYLPNLKDIRIHRWMGTPHKDVALELHGFCDASILAYSAVIYLRILHCIDNAQISLIASKTKVAPLKTLSVPRLELCGASLLIKLMRIVCDELKLKSIPIYAWTDSTIVLTWLKGHPSKWKTFIANRVSDIQTTLPDCKWRFVPTDNNPADCATRGLQASELQRHHLWWTGPSWLSQHSTMWPAEAPCKLREKDLEEKLIVSSHISQVTEQWSLLTRYSSLHRLLRITTWILVFTRNCRNKTKGKISQLTPSEVEQALIIWVRQVQISAFADELRALTKGQSVSRKSKLISLNPILDDKQLLRVGGRLENTSLPYSERHPMIIPSDNHLASLIIQDAHASTLHGGIQLTLQHIRNRFWIIHARHKVRFQIHRCIQCFRYLSTKRNQLMGALPAARVTSSKPFERSGVDYAGPVNVTAIRHRGSKSFKAYIAVFVCLTTRAVHIELVTQLTSEACIAAFRRFVSRRGLCSHLYSDNATNFVGADTILRKQFQDALNQQREPIREALSKDGVEWHFIPPAAPHVGGLWEAAVKSMKHHLRRVIGDTILSIEEMTTLLTQIEACLNSRPLYPLRDDPEDLDVLTPGHFLIGRAPVGIPEPYVIDTSMHCLSRWKLIQAMQQHFWNRWQKEYIHQLQQRRKWQKQQPSVNINDLVLVKEDHLPPCKWMIARIVEVFPGLDGIIRVVKLKHRNGYTKRHINKLCVLPMQ